ncbi:MAG: DesA family fatty acid desaturase [Acidiferrobacteraceae bacterium]
MIDGLLNLPWWGDILAALIMTHLTIISVTIYLHRHQTHRALDLHPAIAHVFRFWLWISTGMLTREWVAIHRKHHAKCETEEDPHSPKIFGIRKVLWQGAELYRKEAKNPATVAKYGHNTPDDWIERRLYTPLNSKGILFMLAIDLVLFGAPGLTIWAVQMIWIPLFAAGVINGLGHFGGYRNYECPDWSTNIIPFGLLIGGEELHNNHHAYASSAKFSSKWWEFDAGWLYIRLLEMVGLAKVRKVAPVPHFNLNKRICDTDTVRAVVINRFQVMARFAVDVLHPVHREELNKLDPRDRERWALLKRTKRLLTREPALIDEAARTRLNLALQHSRALETVYQMKERLQDIWKRSTATQEQLRHALEEWCMQAEATGIQALREFSLHLRTYSVAPVN